jgi:hypothetical protein
MKFTTNNQPLQLCHTTKLLRTLHYQTKLIYTQLNNYVLLLCQLEATVNIRYSTKLNIWRQNACCKSSVPGPRSEV